MIPELSVYDTELLTVEQLFDSPNNLALIADFEVDERGKGLEFYLKNAAVGDERKGFARTYLVKDKISGELAGYFSLRTGLITIQAAGDQFDTFPAAELSNFAVNQRYKQEHPQVLSLGKYMFRSFIIPLVVRMARYIGMYALYIYALPEEKLIEHYKKLGFSRLPPAQEQFVQRHVKPKYDEGCVFMYQTL